MSSKMQFQVFYSDYNVLYGPNVVDLSDFKCTYSAIDKPLERSFGSICKWLQRGFRVDPLTHVITRAGHSGGTEPIGSVPRFLQNFGS